MATIPTYGQEVQSPDNYHWQHIPRASGKDGIGVGLATIAQGTDRLANDFQKQADERSKVWAGQQAGQTLLTETQTLDEAQRKAPAGADGFAKTYMDGFDQRAAAALDAAPDVASRRYLQQHLQAQRTHLGMQAQNFQFKAGDVDVVNRFTDSAETWGRVVQQDPAQYPAALRTLGDTMPDVQPEVRRRMVDHANLSLTNAAASGWLERDPKAVRDMTDKAMGGPVRDKDGNPVLDASGQPTAFKGPTGVPWIDAATPEQVATWNRAATIKAHAIDQAAKVVADARESKTLGTAAYYSATGQGPSEPAAATFSLAPGTTFASARAAVEKAGDPAALQAFDAKYSADKRGIAVANISATRAAVGPTTPLTAVELEAREGAVLQQARDMAEKTHPGDPVFRDKAVSEAHSLWAKDLQALRGQDHANFSTVLDATIKGGATSLSDLPTEAQITFSKLTPQNQLAMQSQFDRNLRAANGEYTKSDAKLVNDLRTRIFKEQGDPQKITNPGQLTEYMGKGLNHTDYERLTKEITQANTPEGSPFLKQVNGVKEYGRKMLTTSMSPVTVAHPELAEEAAYRFGFYVDSRIEEMRKAGQDPHTLFTPGSKDFVLDPAKVAAFMPTESEIASRKAAALAKPAAAAPTAAPRAATPRLPGETPAAYLLRTGGG